MPTRRSSVLPGMNDPLGLNAHLIIALLAMLKLSTAMAADTKRDGPAPPLSVERLLNALHGASAEWSRLKGKVGVVEIWATWCAPGVGFDKDPLAQVIVRPALSPEGGSSSGTADNRQTWAQHRCIRRGPSGVRPGL
jgi:hypothetical protein